MRGPGAWLRGWALPLRLARRDALRSRARSALVLLMIALPVLGVTAAAVVIQTAEVRGAESLDRRLGAAEAQVRVQDGTTLVRQGPDPDDGVAAGGEDGAAPLDADAISALLGGASLLERHDGEVRVISRQGVLLAAASEVDLREPLTAGLFDLVSGRLPRAPGEVVVNRAAAEQLPGTGGGAVGDTLELVGADAVAAAPDPAGPGGPVIVGIAESTTIRDLPVVVGLLGTLGLPVDGTRTWLVDGAPVSWDQVLSLNARGVTVLSRAVLLDPPSVSELPEEIRGVAADASSAKVAVVVLVVVMALLEVVLLAGPAFAVGARRQARSLALMAAAGGTPRQSRRVVLAGAVVLGGSAALLGVVLGIGVAVLALPVVQRHSSTWLGPFQVPWLQLVGIAAFGMTSALLAALAPARIASRQDVVAVLAGRRGDPAPSLRSPLAGLLLLAAGIAGSAFGATRTGGGETVIGFAAVVAVLGMILLVPLVLAALARLAHRLPLTLRYAVRDAARHRSRTVPAVAAVAATVAGVVALGIAVTSDTAEQEATYVPQFSAGLGVLTGYAPDGGWPALRSVIAREAPEATITEVRGIAEYGGRGLGSDVTYLQIERPGDPSPLIDSWGSSLGAGVLVDDDALPAALVGVSADEARVAAAALRAGGAAVLTSGALQGADRVVLVASTYDSATGEPRGEDVRVTVPAAFVEVGPQAGAQAVISAPVAAALGVAPTTVGLVAGGVEITPEQEDAIAQATRARSLETSFVVERGYVAGDEARVVQLVLAGLGAVLMLGGTLTATFLALSDARPDLATLAAVGASPRTRRGIAAAYAVVVGSVGALLGAAVGFVPGIAVAFPLTRRFTGGLPDGSAGAAPPGGPYVDVPWLMILSLVVALPLMTALVVALAARSRLPLVARQD